MKKEEIWKAIEGYNDYYVSNLGRVKSTKRGKEIILKQFKLNKHYHVTLTENNIAANYRVINLILITFTGEHRRRLDVMFIDGNQDNLCLDNLEIINKVRYSKRLTKETVMSIYNDCKEMRVIDVAKKYNLAQCKVSSIKNRITYRGYTKNLITS